MQVIAKNQYVVRVHNLSEHEQVILNMIFAISQKSSARSNGYTQQNEPSQLADIIIRGDDSAMSSAATIPELRIVDAMTNDTEQPVLLRPLIATRVLAVLDDVVAHIASRRQPLPLKNTGRSGVVVEFKPLTPPSDLAIVADEATSHPDNYITPDVTALDSEAIAAAVDALLLSTPEETAHSDDFDVGARYDTPHATTGAPRRRAIVVVDSAAVRKQLEIELKVFSVDVAFAASARRAIEMIASDDYAIAFIDAVLPEWDGFRICKHIKTRSPQTAVVMMLSQLAVGDKLKGTLSGCDGYLIKPVGRLTFQTLVRNHLPLQADVQLFGA